MNSALLIKQTVHMLSNLLGHTERTGIGAHTFNCGDCNSFYTGQIERSFEIRKDQHFLPDSLYVNHSFANKHRFHVEHESDSHCTKK